MFYIFPNTSFFWSIYARRAKQFEPYIYAVKPETLIMRAIGKVYVYLYKFSRLDS